MNEECNSPRMRGIYLLPNLFTVGALFAGFYAIVAATKGHFDLAAIAIFVAMVLDGLDGRIARLTHSQSEFGAQMDSLSDMVCFGVTPALVMYSWSLFALGKLGWLAAFMYTVCTALRLARFNSQAESTNKRYSQGLTTTAAAGFIASIIWVATELNYSGPSLSILIFVVMIVVALLKVSTIRYRSFKDFDVRGKVPFIGVILLVLIFVLISYRPPFTFLLIFTAYVVSGPIETIWNLRRKKRERAKVGQTKDQ
jgi:CDP-diacylglycerol--serine O-phosphatidyltransferase